MDIRLAHNMTIDSIVDGPGIRAVIWTQGCRHKCLGCHNEDTQDFNGGYIENTENIINELKRLRLHKGITFSGGEPFEQAEACTEIAINAKKMGFDIWCYTGYKFESLTKEKNPQYNKGWKNFLKEIDVLIDGPFILEKKDLNLLFRGSENQRIIDVEKSLMENKVVIKKEFHKLTL